jgi:hypothetical protein
MNDEVHGIAMDHAVNGSAFSISPELLGSIQTAGEVCFRFAASTAFLTQIRAWAGLTNLNWVYGLL